MTDAEVPDFFRRLWRLPATPPRRGRRTTLDVDAVVDAAVRIADSGGLEAATLPKVAAELNVTPMSLYRHVGSKHELLQLMMDAASSPPPSPPASADWREGLQRWAEDLWALYRDRAWLPQVPIYRAPSGPNQIAWLEQGFSQLADTALTWQEKVAFLNVLSGYVRHSALLHHELEEGRGSDQAQSESEREYGEALHRVVPAEHYPHTSAMLSSGMLANTPADERGPDRGFREGLDFILDGLAVRISNAPGTPLSRPHDST